MLLCPNCGSSDLRVVETRMPESTAGPQNIKRRRRECRTCVSRGLPPHDARFTTVEQIETEAGLHLSAAEHARLVGLLNQLLPLLRCS
jgi:transcriptional regulator NrdR family protein